MVISELIEELQEAEKKGIPYVVVEQNDFSSFYIKNVTCDGIDSTVDIKLTSFHDSEIYRKHDLTFGLSLRQLIKELQSMRVGYGGDIEVTCMEFEIDDVITYDGKCHIISPARHYFCSKKVYEKLHEDVRLSVQYQRNVRKNREINYFGKSYKNDEND